MKDKYLSPTLCEILSKCKTGGTRNYLSPHLDKIILLLQKLEDNAGKDFSEEIIRLEYKKNDFLIREGSTPHCIWFIEEGIARKYVNRDGEEISQHFFCSGEFIFLYENSILYLPTNHNIQFIENSIVYAIKWEVYEHLKIKYSIIIQLERLILAAYVGWLEKRLNMCQHSSADKKYQHLTEIQPHLLERVPHHYIASYLDITRETLSRIRKKNKRLGM